MSTYLKATLAGLWQNVRNTLYAVKLGLSVMTGIGRSKNHQQALAGLKFRHFAIGGLIAAAIIVSSIIMLVRHITA